MKTRDNTLYTVTVPCVPESFIVMEDLCETFLGDNDEISPEDAILIRLSVAEACRNALSRQRTGDDEDSFSVASLGFYRASAGKAGLALEITDPGAGFRLDGKVPPYPEEMVGTEHRVASLLGQCVIARVESPVDVVLVLRRDEESDDPEATREEMIMHAGEHGLGLLALCRCWERVLYSYDPVEGNRLWLEGMRSSAS